MAILLAVAERYQIGQRAEHHDMHYLVGAEPLPERLHRRETRPRQGCQHQYDEAADQAGVDIPCKAHQWLANESFVSLRVEQAVNVCRVADFDLDHPALAVRVFVDQLRSVSESLVELNDLTCDRQEKL